MFENGVDQGYKTNPNWWNDPSDPDCYRYADLDKDYPPEYFPLAEPPRVKEFCQRVIDYYKKITGEELKGICEFGSAGGWYLKEFQDRHIDVQGYEGSFHGVMSCLSRGVFKANIKEVDFRFPVRNDLFRPLDFVLCTEVAEHVESAFSGGLVQSIINHSNLVWWSSESPDTNQAHLHHPNEQPLQYWIKLFEFFDYGCHMLPNFVHEATGNRGRCIFYNKNVYKL